MGQRHALSGVLAAVVSAPLASSVVSGGLAGPESGAHPALWAAGWVAGAMLPDFDHPGAHASRVWGPVTQGAAWAVGKVCGGHRESTHDVVVAPLAVAVATAALIVGMGAFAAWHWSLALVGLVGLALPFGIALRMVGGPFRNGLVNLGAALGLSMLLIRTEGAHSWFPLILAGGVVVHILCDSVTSEGAPVPLVWMWDKERGRKRQWGARLFSVGSFPEVMCGPLFAVLIVAVAVFYVASGLVVGVSVPVPAAPSVPLPTDGFGWSSVEDLGRWASTLGGG